MISEVVKIPMAFTTFSGIAIVLLQSLPTFDPMVWGEKATVVAVLLLIGYFGAKWANKTIDDYKAELKDSQDKLLASKDEVIKGKDEVIVAKDKEIEYLKGVIRGEK